MAKTTKHAEAYCTVDTFWNKERIKRGYTYQQIMDRFNKTSVSTVANWFIGRFLPNDKIIEELCEWFDINLEKGKSEFERAHQKYEAQKGKKLIARCDTEEKIMVDINYNMTVRFLMKQRQKTFKSLAHDLKCTTTMVRRWVFGIEMPNDVYIQKIADILEYDVDNLEKLFVKACDSHKNIEGQEKIEDYTPDDALNSSAPIPSFPVPTGEDYVEVSFSPEVEQALQDIADQHDDHERFVKWFDILSNISPARITDTDVVEIMNHYVTSGYSMFMALEAYHNESYNNNRSNYVRERYILLTCERNDWLGEDHE